MLSTVIIIGNIRLMFDIKKCVRKFLRVLDYFINSWKIECLHLEEVEENIYIEKGKKAEEKKCIIVIIHRKRRKSE